MKTITIEQLRERGIKKGDLYHIEHSVKKLTGWYLVISSNFMVSLNAENKNSYGYGNFHFRNYLVTKFISNEDLSNSLNRSGISRFFKTFDESLVENIITTITHNPLSKYVHAVHFGSTKLYTWRVPEGLGRVDFKVGDIVEVDTMYGKQYVQVKETAEYEHDEKTKEVLALIKTEDLPF